MMELAYFPGCATHSLARDYDRSARLVCDRLGIGLRDIEDWSCCGASVAHSVDGQLAIDLADRNLALAQTMGYAQVTTPCAGCFSRLKTAAAEKAGESAPSDAGTTRKRDAVAPDVVHLLQLIVEAAGLDRVAAEVRRPLAGFKLAAYYGCLLTRPHQVTRFDDPEQPTSMDRLLTALGAETVDWSHKAECCGGGLSASETDLVVELTGEVVAAARRAGAEAVVVACPVCQINLDSRQRAAAVSSDERRLPVPYFVQLMGLAFGFTPKQLGLRRLLTDPVPLLKAKGIR
jgi:heterodisulfide reductase subunit B2